MVEFKEPLVTKARLVCFCSSFERLLLHALCQYMDLVSASKSLVLVLFSPLLSSLSS